MASFFVVSCLQMLCGVEEGPHCVFCLKFEGHKTVVWCLNVEMLVLLGGQQSEQVR